MSYKIIFFIFIFLLSGCSVGKEIINVTTTAEKTDDYYHLDEKKIYALNSSFAPLGGSIQRIYIDTVDYDTFEALGGGYAKDKNKVYLYARNLNIIKNADVKTFEYIDGEYSKDKNNVYFRGNAIEGADPKSFKMIKQFFSSDKNSVFLYDHRMEGADSSTFEVVSWNRAKDKNHLYEVDMNNGEMKILN